MSCLSYTRNWNKFLSYHRLRVEKQTLLRKEDIHKDRIYKIMLRSQPIDPLRTPEFTYSYPRWFTACWELLNSSTCHLSSTLPTGFLPAPPELTTKKCWEINILRGSPYQLRVGSEWISAQFSILWKDTTEGHSTLFLRMSQSHWASFSHCSLSPHTKRTTGWEIRPQAEISLSPPGLIQKEQNWLRILWTVIY